MAVNQSKKQNATRKVTIRFTPEEYTKVHQGFAQTTKRKLSEYIRYILLDKPVTVYIRSRSLDELTNEMVLLRNELSAIGNNFNQAVKRLHSLSHLPELKTWIMQNEIDKEKFFRKVAEIKSKINQMSDEWLQE